MAVDISGPTKCKQTKMLNFLAQFSARNENHRTRRNRLYLRAVNSFTRSEQNLANQ